MGASTARRTKAIAIGRAVREAQRTRIEDRDRGDPRRRAWASALFSGKVIDVERRATEGYLRGTPRLDGVGRVWRGVTMRDQFPERMDRGLARRRGDRACTPDLICVLDFGVG